MKSFGFSAILIGAVASLSAFADTPDPISATYGPRIENFHPVVANRIYRSARPSDQDLVGLANEGIRVIVDLQGGDRLGPIPFEAGETPRAIAHEKTIVQSLGMKFFSVPLDSLAYDVAKQEPSFIQALRLIADSEHHPVLFHCRHGDDRTGLIAALYRVVYQGCSPEAADREMLEDGHSTKLPRLDDYLKDDSVALRDKMHVHGHDCPLE